ncbi:MAG: SDR family oxidoreductase [Candidatus Omnitrophica bacterium]|nr:SDR family oxidoreductase [Candidatus Omnitrophota bacterium]
MRPVNKQPGSSTHSKSLSEASTSISPENFQIFLQVIAALGDDPGYLARVSPEDRIRLMKAAGLLSHPTIEENRRIARTARKLRIEKHQRHDREMRKSTGIREAREDRVFTAPKQIEESIPRPVGEFKKPRNCYICKAAYTQVHFFYDSICPECADLNYRKRFQSASLEGRTALVTGGRVKIGFQTALKLLRAGARTLVSTRFPQDAALRFSREEDFDLWKHRLQIFGLDLRHSPSVEIFARYLCNTEERLDILVNNAAQTVRKPPGFYRHLMEWELKRVKDLPEPLRSVLIAHEACKRSLDGALLPLEDESSDHSLLKIWPGKSPAIGIRASAKLSMIPYHVSEESGSNDEIFPEGKLDADLQQVDLRSVNSWRLLLAEVSTSEMLEVHLVNAVAPFILAAKLKPLMLRHSTGAQHIVNASAMEGKFSRYTKTDKHPHTNMAKAALNMLTLTSAADYQKSGIHMNAVDTGWITDEDSAEISQAKKSEHDFEPPLDIVDGAARLLDPVFFGILTGDHVWGKFLKDYQPTAW